MKTKRVLCVAMLMAAPLVQAPRAQDIPEDDNLKAGMIGDSGAKEKAGIIGDTGMQGKASAIGDFGVQGGAAAGSMAAPTSLPGSEVQQPGSIPSSALEPSAPPR